MKTIENVNASQVKDRISSVSRPQNLLAKHFILVRQSDVVMQQARFGQPMRLNERRFLHILNGQAVYRINLLDYTLRQGDFLVLPPDTIVEVGQYLGRLRRRSLAHHRPFGHRPRNSKTPFPRRCATPLVKRGRCEAGGRIL